MHSPDEKEEILREAAARAIRAGQLGEGEALRFLLPGELLAPDGRGAKYTSDQANGLGEWFAGVARRLLTTNLLTTYYLLRLLPDCTRLQPQFRLVAGVAFIGFIEDDKLLSLEPLELVEVYHELDRLAWAHPAHGQRECTYDEWYRKYQTFLATG